MKHILFFSHYTPWLPHTLWEVTLAYALRQRGHAPRFLTCGGLSDCGMSPARQGDHPENCANCRNIASALTSKLRQNVSFFQSAIKVADREQVAAWLDGLDGADPRSARFEDLPLGAWVWPEMVSYWHSPEPDMERPEVAQSFRELLQGAALASLALPRLYDSYQTDILVMLNGAFFLHRVAFEIARKRGIRCVTHERGWRDNTLAFNVNALINDMTRYRDYWNAWRDVPLTLEEVRAAHELLLQRRQGKNMNWAAFTTSPTAQDQPTPAPAGRRTALLCTSSDCEASAVERMPEFDQRQWISTAVDWFAAHPQYDLVIRVHPNEMDHAEVDDRSLRRYREMAGRLPSNARLIQPDEKASTYSLMDAADVGLTFGSTAGLEMAALGIPLIHAGHGIYFDAGFTYETPRLADLPAQLDRVMDLPRSEEARRLTYRYIYRTYYGLSVPLNKVKVSASYYEAELAYQSTAELEPGRDPQLDAVAEYILGEYDLFPGPTEAEIARSEEEERAFFSTLMREEELSLPGSRLRERGSEGEGLPGSKSRSAA